MSELTKREVAIFNAARGLDGSERAAYLDQACAGDAALRQRLDELLRVDEPAGDFLEKPAYGDTGAAAIPGAAISLSAALSEKPGDRIGRYKLLQQIGEGGCGVVYMAEQEEPVHRRVALKVIKLGMDTKQVIARFEAERQALALMDHPNIAKVLDAGATETGRPYFVMELIKAIPITRYSDENKLSTMARLGLFVQVCQAVQHAHQKGIIHRDIKPSNILVADHDGVAVPKIIDFGIAKATSDQRLTDKTVFTAFEQFVGTPAYMSPEQARLSGLDIDTRTDIYSLGVLLYELLTGKTPFEAKRLLEAGLDEIRRIIREEEPVRPSTRLQTLDAAEQTTVAKLRQSEPPKLLHLIRGDLDWIVMKCLEKNRSRRYETANGLARDIERHLHDELVTARPPSRLYELQKTVRRHKFGFAAAAALLTVLAGGVLISTREAIHARRAEREQIRLRQEAQENEKRIKTQVAEIIHDFGGGGVVATKILMTMGKLPEAEALTKERLAAQRKSHGEKPAELLPTLDLLGTILVREGRLDEAKSLYREALTIEKNLDSDPEVVLGLHDLAFILADRLDSQGKLGDAEEIYSEFIAYAQTNSALLQWTWGQSFLFEGGEMYARHGRWKEADNDLAKFLQLQPTNWRIHHALAPVLVAREDLERYQKLCQLIVARSGGDTNPITADWAAKDCLILPSSGADLDVVGRMADRAVAAGTNNALIAYFQCTKGLAEYRLSHFASALDWLGKTIYIGGHRDTYMWDDYLYVEAYAVSAMAHYKLNHPDSARSAFAKANEIAEARLPKLDSGNIGSTWRDQIIAHALLREAGQLLGLPTGSLPRETPK